MFEKPNAPVAPACKYCKVGRLAPNGENILCEKRGIMTPNSGCKGFQYDPSKSDGVSKGRIKDAYTEEDFI